MGQGEFLVGEALLQDFMRYPVNQHVGDCRRPLEEPRTRMARELKPFPTRAFRCMYFTSDSTCSFVYG